MTDFLFQSSEFLQGYRSAEHGGLGEAWNEVHRSPMQPFPHGQVGQILPQLAEFEQIYNNAGPFPQPTWEGKAKCDTAFIGNFYTFCLGILMHASCFL